MKNFLIPDFMFESYREITPDFLLAHGIRALLIDIDNTLAPYEMPDPDENIIAWFSALKAAGIKAALVSNNHKERVERFNAPLGLVAFWDSHKPLKKTLLLAIKTLGVEKKETAMLGDQLLTDAFAGKHIGLPAMIVPPIKDKTNLFFKAKRLLERKHIRKYAKENGYANWMSFWHVKEKKQ